MDAYNENGKSSLQSKTIQLLAYVESIHETLTSVRAAALPTSTYIASTRSLELVEQIKDQAKKIEQDNRSLEAVIQIGQFVNSSVELNRVLEIVMDSIIRLTNAERGFLMLKNPAGEMEIRTARNFDQMTIDENNIGFSNTVIERVIQNNTPVLTTNAREDPRFQTQDSVIEHNLRSILCVPLRIKNEVIGVIYADNRIRSGLFSQAELDLLTAFSNQAAVAIDNAELFTSVSKTLAEVTDLKNLMDNVLSSITSGVITIDMQKKILLCNSAAEGMIAVESDQIIAQDIEEIFAIINLDLSTELNAVLNGNKTLLDLDVVPILPERGQVSLGISMTPLVNAAGQHQGAVIVLEDLTEKKKLEAQRSLFEKMVSPAVISQLDPNKVELGGKRSEITVLFADIRGFTRFSEEIPPEKLVQILNNYLSLAAGAVLNEEGTIDKFLGDAIMAWFNAPVPQPDHALRAVRVALNIRSAVSQLQQQYSPKYRLSFGIGIHFGDAVLGLIGNERRADYTAIGDSINTAKRIQESAEPGQILISAAVQKRVRALVNTREIEPIRAKGKTDLLAVFEVLELAGKIE